MYFFNTVFSQNFVCFSLIILILPETFLFYFKFIYFILNLFLFLIEILDNIF